jgi:hypothetical protein
MPMLVVLAVLEGPALASMPPWTRTELCGLARRVVVGHVTTAGRSSWTPTGLIETRFELTVDRSVFGTGPGALALVIPGGVVGDVGLRVEHAASLDPGRPYLLLLDELRPGDWRIVGGELGAIPLRTETTTGEPEDEAIASLGACDAR